MKELLTKIKIGTNEGKTERLLEILLRIYMQVKDFYKDSKLIGSWLKMHQSRENN